MKELYQKSNRKLYYNLILIIFILILLSLLYLFYNFTGEKIKNGNIILTYIRIPRLLMGIIAGAGLAVVGLAFQGLFKNPIAEPYLLGVSAGSSFGAVIGYYFHLQKIAVIGEFLIIANSFFWGLITVYLAMMIANFKKKLNIISLILTGVVMNALFYSIIFLIISLNYDRLSNMFLWLWGKIPSENYSIIILTSIIFLVSYFILLSKYKALTLLSISKNMAESKGIDVRKTSIAIIVYATLITSTIVSICGIIGFVGLIVPHIVRLIIGNDFKKLLIIAPIFGAAFMILSDIISRYLFYPSFIPVGIVTSIIGAPLFFFLMKRQV